MLMALAETRALALQTDSVILEGLDGYTFEVRERDGRWRVEENGSSIASFPDVEDAVPLALSYAECRADAGHHAVVFLKAPGSRRLRLARYGRVGELALQAAPVPAAAAALHLH